MRDIAVVAFAQRQEAKINTESEVEFMVPLMNQAKDAVGLTQQEMGFTCSVHRTSLPVRPSRSS